MAGARAYVSPPLFTPSPFGLLTTIPPQDDGGDEHWQSGIVYQPVCAQPSAYYEECIAITGSGGAPPPPAALSTFTSGVSVAPRAATSFEVVMPYTCSVISEAVGPVEQAFAAWESWQVERSFWTGLAAGQTIAFPHLAANAVVTDASGVGAGGANIQIQTAATVITGSGGASGQNIAETLGLIEAQLANCYSGVGVIHVPVAVLDTMAANNLVVFRGQAAAYTPNGNRIIAGNGYPGTSPAGAVPAAGTSWIYATGNLMRYEGDIAELNDEQAFDKAHNTYYRQKRRKHLVAWDCCHVAGLVAGLGVPKGT